MKKIISIFCVTVILFAFCGCRGESVSTKNTETEPYPDDFKDISLPDEVIFENDLYTLKREGGLCYIISRQYENPAYTKPPSDSNNPSQTEITLHVFRPAKVVYFDSIKDFYDTVAVKGMDNEKFFEILYWLGKDKSVQVYDIEQLYVPVFPEEFEPGNVTWKSTGKEYSVKGVPKNEKYERCYMMISSEDIFNNVLKLYKPDCEFFSGGVKYTAFGRYFEDSEHYSVRVFLECNGKYFEFDVMFKPGVMKEMPDKDWIDDFSVKLYKPEE